MDTDAMEELRGKQQMLDDKIKELQQQVRYCINEYDYYHKNNELDIINEQKIILEEAGKVYKGFLAQFERLRVKIDQGFKMCDDVDRLIQDMNLPPAESEDDESDKENVQKHVHFNFSDSRQPEI